MESPLPYDAQDDVLKTKFDQLIASIESIDNNSPETEIASVIEHIQREVTENPILARIEEDHDSLLSVACINRSSNYNGELYILWQRGEHFLPVIKFLILANPFALLWGDESRAFRDCWTTKKTTVHKIAGHSSLYALMPWVATNYQWVLDHEICLADPPMSNLLYRYGYDSEDTRFISPVIQQFFEAYPRGLTQVDQNGNNPLHLIMTGDGECHAELFKWVAEKWPSNMLGTDNFGCTKLHFACDLLHGTCRELGDHLGEDSGEICKYLIAKCPESVQIMDNDSLLPIHYLRRYCRHRPVKEVVVCLLREYPQSYNMASETTTGRYRAPSSIPFIQRIKLLLDEERELGETVADLQQVSGVFKDAVGGTDNPSPLASSTYSAFDNWAKSFTRDLEARKGQISTQLQDECNAE